VHVVIGQASPLSSPDVDGDVAGKAAGLQNDIGGVSRTADQLTVSFYALFAWVVVVTVALSTVVAVTCRRWRRQRRRRAAAAADWDVVAPPSTTDDASSLCSRPTTDRTPAAAAAATSAAAAVCRDRTALEGVEIGRRASPSTVDDRSLAVAGAEP